MSFERIPLQVDEDINRLVLQVLAVWGARRTVYQAAGLLLEIKTDTIVSGSVRPEKSVTTSVVSAQRVKALASEHCQFQRTNNKGDLINCIPPEWLSHAIVSRKDFPGIPVLESISNGPVLRVDGSIQTEPGYDEFTGNLYISDGTVYPALPESPTLDDARRAAQELAEPFLDFPWEGWQKDDAERQENDLAAALACILTIISRSIIAGPVPCFAFKATTPGSGKGLIVSTINGIAVGGALSLLTLPTDETELRKLLLSLALRNARITAFDNINGPVGSGVLSSAITSGQIEDRLLGSSKTVEASWRSVVIVNGNGMSFVNDFWRRVVLANIDPQCEDPTERQVTFRHQDLGAFVRANRPRLYMAALTIIRAHKLAVARGETKGHGKQKKISFESWDDTVRAPLLWVGADDPCVADGEIRHDTDLEQLSQLLTAWHDAFKDKAITLAEAIDTTQPMFAMKDGAVTHETRRALLNAFSSLDMRTGERFTTGSLGYQFRKLKGRVVDGLCLTTAGLRNKVAMWKVVKAKPRIVPQNAQVAGNNLFN